MAQNNRKKKNKKGHNRSSSVPSMASSATPTPATNSIAISAYFPPQLAAALQNGIQVGYYQNMPTDRPNLLKSHSGFVSKDIPQQNQDDNKSNRGSTSVVFMESQNVISPTQSASPPLSPTTFEKLKLDNQYPSNGSNGFILGGNSNRNSIHAHFQGIPSSPSSFRLGSFGHGGSSLKLDLSEILLDGDATPRSSLHSIPFGMGSMGSIPLHTQNDSMFSNGSNGNNNNGHQSHDTASSSSGNLLQQPNGMTLAAIQSPDCMEFTGNITYDPERRVALTSPKGGIIGSPKEFGNDQQMTKPPYPLRKTYSNQSLFTLYSGDDMSSADDLLANTKLNAKVPADLDDLELEQKSTESASSQKKKYSTVMIGDINDVDVMNLKEDFMEYQSEQRDAFNNIGNGASGIVRKAFHFRSCKMVAIKQCRSKQSQEVQAFMREAKIYQKPEFEDNENIISIMGFGKDKENGNLAMAMEYMDLGSCESLNIAIDKRLTMDMKELCVGHIILNVLYALNAIHRKGYVHNDIKPANILSNKYGEIKLSDFGTVQKMKNRKHRLTKNNGTQRYQSPEKMINQPISYNQKSDIWSLGVTAYELLFGDEYNAQDELAFITNTPKLTPKEHKISEECCDFIQKCLTANDKDRPSADNLIEHEWITKHIITTNLDEKWPWLIEIEDEKSKDILAAIDNIDKKNNGKKKNGTNKKNGKKKMVKFADSDDTNNGHTLDPKNIQRSNRSQHHLYNEDLLFMISALIIYYSTQNVDLDSNDQPQSMLHRRVSHVKNDKESAGGKTYSDDERIANMAKYALCSKEMVTDRIRVTVAYIKSQINKTEKL